MQVGVNFGFGNLHENLSDAEMFRGEARLAVRVEELGFDSVWSVEHHFDDYSMCPDNLQFLTWVAAQTEHLKLGTAAVILPWHDPIRVAEKLIMLDILSEGRVLFGMGRGLSRKEYAAMRVEMGESRERFDEAAPMILRALETGVMAGEGPYYPQPETVLRPRPVQSFADRIYCVATSPDSIVSAVACRARLLAILTRPVDDTMDTFISYREQYRDAYELEAPPIAINVGLYCNEDGDVARERGDEIVLRFFYSNVDHYEMAGDHFRGIAGYQRYDEQAKMLREIGLENVAAGFAACALIGTPDELIEKLEHIREVMGSFELHVIPSFGGLPPPQAEASLELFAEEVLPIVSKFD